MADIRAARASDASRIAEILIFTKRCHYRDIFRNDKVSFVDMQVLPLANSYIADPSLLNNVWVYDDGIVKGVLRMDGRRIDELFTDTFFQGQGVGGALIRFAINEHGAKSVWVLEKTAAPSRFTSATDLSQRASAN